ncbi:MAG: PDZ domain-containing protein [Planctomycetes bacterium]|nr:PDZ domain-containing protein [Planctomycetota bacterium]
MAHELQPSAFTPRAATRRTVLGRFCPFALAASFLLISCQATPTAHAQAPAAGGEKAEGAPAAEEVEKRVKKALATARRSKGPMEGLWNGAAEIVALGQPAVAHLEGALEDESPRVRLCAAVSLCRLGVEADAVTTLSTLVATEGDLETRLAAARALKAFGEEGDVERAVKALESAAAAGSPERLRVAAAEGLFALKEDPDPALLEGVIALAAKGATGETRREAALTAVRMDQAAAAKVLDPLSEAAEEPTERGAAARVALETWRLKNPEKGDEKGAGGAKPEEPAKPFLVELIYLAKRHYLEQERVLNKKEKQEKGLDLAVQDLIALGMVKRLDPFSDYYNKTSHEQRRDDIAGSYGGIGAYVRRDADDKFVVITQPNYNGPAYRAGIRSGDEIVGADGERFDDRDSLGRPKDLAYVIKKLKGRPGTKVDILIMRHGWTEPRIMPVVRAQVRVDTVETEMLPGDVAYVRLTQFGGNSGPEMRQALSHLEDEGMKGIILDLRGNTGGQLNAVQQVAECFLPPESVISTMKGRWDQWTRQPPLLAKGRKAYGQPMVCLINDGSASGSEMLSAALKDHDRARLLGENTFGKGSGQNAFPIAGYGEERWLKLTLFKFYSPSGKTIHEIGVAPHREVKAPEWPLWKSYERDRLLKARAFEKYLDQHGEADRKALTELADFDDADPGRYPGFDAWYAALDTTLSRDDARRFLRIEGVRRLVADQRGAKFVQNYQDDDVLQEAIIDLFRRMGDADLQALKSHKRYTTAFGDKLKG